MSLTPLSGANHPLKGIGLMVLATFLFASHDAMSKYLSGFYPIILIVWARYLVHTLLMAGIFLPQSGLRVLRTKRPGLQVLRALCLLGVSLLFTTGLMFIPLAEATSVIMLFIFTLVNLALVLIKRRDPTRPQFWHLSYTQPHPPIVPLAAYLERYAVRLAHGLVDKARGGHGRDPGRGGRPRGVELGLDEVLVRTECAGAGLVRLQRRAGQHQAHHCRAHGIGTNLLKYFESADLGEVKVQDHRFVAGIVAGCSPELAQCLFAILCDIHFNRPAAPAQHFGEQDYIARIVFDKQNHVSIVASGNVKCISVPRPGAESTQIRPPCDFTTRAQIDRPIPDPGNSPRCSRRTKGAKI